MGIGRVLAVDYGVKNVGLACCDELGIAVRPLPSIPNQGRKDLLKRLQSAIVEHGIDRLVVGIPWNMDGSAGEAVRRVERFKEVVLAALDLPLSCVDERLSTMEAAEIWREMTARQQRRYRTVDSLAAAFILERFIEEA